MRALTIRQPWAWLIIHGGKDIENRLWRTQIRGPFLVHAAKAMSRRDYEDAQRMAERVQGYAFAHDLPLPEQFERGGIIGQVELVEVLPVHMTAAEVTGWRRVGDYGFQLRNPQPLPFFPCTGALGFWGEFDVEGGRVVQRIAPPRGGGRKRSNLDARG